MKDRSETTLQDLTTVIEENICYIGSSKFLVTVRCSFACCFVCVCLFVHAHVYMYVLVINKVIILVALIEKNKAYSEKQKSGGAPTQSMLKIAWDLQELSQINEAGRELRVECELLADKLNDPAYDPATLLGSL